MEEDPRDERQEQAGAALPDDAHQRGGHAAENARADQDARAAVPHARDDDDGGADQVAQAEGPGVSRSKASSSSSTSRIRWSPGPSRQLGGPRLTISARELRKYAVGKPESPAEQEDVTAPEPPVRAGLRSWVRTVPGALVVLAAVMGTAATLVFGIIGLPQSGSVRAELDFAYLSPAIVNTHNSALQLTVVTIRLLRFR